MKSNNHWTKTELQVYTMLLCANADGNETQEEIEMIKSKTDADTFKKIHEEFLSDTEDERFEKIDHAIHQHEYSPKELSAFRREIYEIFFSDCSFTSMERHLDKVLDNILY